MHLCDKIERLRIESRTCDMIFSCMRLKHIDMMPRPRRR